MRTDHQFSQTKRADIPRSSFDLSHGLKTTFDSGRIIPILSLEILPGDTINCRASLFGRMATPIKPVLDNLYLETFFFFTPYRQVWENFTKFHGEQNSPGDSIDFVVPKITGAPVAEESIGDYLGIPIGLDYDLTDVSALPFRCHNKIFNFWFRDENLVDPQTEFTDDGPDGAGQYNVNRRRKRRDYITSCLPFRQKGDTVIVPLGDVAPIYTTAIDNQEIVVGQDKDFVLKTLMDDGGAGLRASVGQTAADLNFFADLTTATGVSINDLRESFQIQKLLERDARGGTRYPEILRSHFQVTDPQLLVHQRPLFLGGGSTMINITPVAQTTDQLEAAAGDTPQGNLAAYATVSAKGHGFTASFTEHGHILGYVNVRADLTYQQGLERYWSRKTRYDFYYPALSHLGEMAVLKKELFVRNDGASGDDTVFGYMPIYDDYRFKQSQITGLFRSDAGGSLDVWHLAQDFDTQPSLNANFINDSPPVARVIAVPSEPEFLLDVYFKIRAARPLPLYATPGLIDHF